MKNTLALSAAAIALLMTSVASAAVFAFSYDIPATPSTPTAVMASGTLTADPTGTPGEFLVTAISGTRNGEMIIPGGLIPPGGFASNNNLIFTTAPHLTGNGLSYTVACTGDDGSGDVNVFFATHSGVPFGYTEFSNDVGFTSTFTLTAIPEPSTWVLMVLGFAGLGYVGYGSSRRASIGRAGLTESVLRGS
jgi:hypothetical protein